MTDTAPTPQMQAVINDLLMQGWSFYYDPSTHFIGMRHPKGGQQSIANVVHPWHRDVFGALMASALAPTPQQEPQANPPAIPGWRLVPEEPTPEMITAYLDANCAYWARVDELPGPVGEWSAGTVKEATAESYAALIAAAPAAPAPAAVQPVDEPLRKLVGALLGIGVGARTDETIAENIQNARRRSDCLWAIEREFFTTHEQDEDYPEGPPFETCLLNWGAEPAEYVEQMRAALATAHPPAAPAAPVEAQKPVAQPSEAQEWVAFEAWAPKLYLCLTRSEDEPDRYLHETTDDAWDAWQARAAIASHTQPQAEQSTNHLDPESAAWTKGFEDGQKHAAIERAMESPPCVECGAMTQQEAETKCRCNGDKDDCHGCRLWPDDTESAQAPQAVAQPTTQAAEPAAPTAEAAHAMGATGSPAIEAERLAFEAWMRGHCWALSAVWENEAYRGAAESLNYICPRAMNTRQLWAAWRDRAALASAPQATPVAGDSTKEQ